MELIWSAFHTLASSQPYVKSALLPSLPLAFPVKDKKVYVQHLLRRNQAATWSLIHEQKASIFVAGSAKDMPKDVRGM